MFLEVRKKVWCKQMGEFCKLFCTLLGKFRTPRKTWVLFQTNNQLQFAIKATQNLFLLLTLFLPQKILQINTIMDAFFRIFRWTIFQNISWDHCSIWSTEVQIFHWSCNELREEVGYLYAKIKQEDNLDTHFLSHFAWLLIILWF